MAASDEYPERVKQVDDGIYRWRCRTEAEYEKMKFNKLRVVSLFIAAGMIFTGLLIGVLNSADGFLWIVVLTALFFMAIIELVILICKGQIHDTSQIYEMADSYIKSGSGDSSEYFFYQGVRKMLVEEKYIELRGMKKKFRAYIPDGDLAYVSRYMRVRMPEGAEIEERC